MVEGFNKTRHSERGVAVVEFAILVVIFLIIVFGLLEFSVMFFQKHYIAGAAREGVRVGVIANNYNCFNGACGPTVDRYEAVCDKVLEYLGAVFDNENITCTSVPEGDIENNTINIVRKPEVGVASESVELSVQVTVNNFMPEMLSGLVPGYNRPETFSHAATGAYEDPNEP